jgi:hypothetical protein
MGANQQIVQLLERIQSALEEFKDETKQQFSSNIDQENWKAVAVLNDCASLIDAGIGACGLISARCVSLEVADPATASDDQASKNPYLFPDWNKPYKPSIWQNLWMSESISRSPWIYKEKPKKSAFLKKEGAPGIEYPLRSLYTFHPFWPTFFDRGVPFHPELANKKPTGGGRKIGPTILPGIQIDVAYSSRGVSCRLLSMKPEKLKPLLKLKSQFSEAVDGEIEWNDGSKNRSQLSVTVRPASNLEQQGWPIEEKVARLLKLYGQIKQFVIENLE